MRRCQNDGLHVPVAEHCLSSPLPRRSRDQGAEKRSGAVPSAVSGALGVPCNGKPPPPSTSSNGSDGGSGGGATGAAAAGIPGGTSPAVGRVQTGDSQFQPRAGAQTISSVSGRMVGA